MPYSIKTKDGYVIKGIPDDLDPNSEEVKQKVAAFVAKQQGGVPGEQPQAQPSRFQPRIQEALQEGDPELASFYERQAEQASIEGTAEDPGVIDRIGEAAGRVGFEAKRAFGKAKEFVTQESRQTVESRTLPDVGGLMKNVEGVDYGRVGSIPYAVEKGVALPIEYQNRVQNINLLSGSMDETLQMYREKMPEVSIYQDEKGNPIAIFPNGYMATINKPAPSLTDVSQLAQKGAAFALTGGRGGAVRQVASAVGTQAGLEAGGAMYGGSFDADEIVLSGIMEGVGLGVAKSIGKTWSKLTDRQKAKVDNWRDLEGVLDERTFQELKAYKEAVEGLNAPEAIGPQFAMRGPSSGRQVQAMREAKEALSRPGQAERFAERTKEQDIWAIDNIRETLNSIPSKGDALEYGTRAVRQASDDVFEAFRQIRREEAQKLFGEAFENQGKVNVVPVREKVRELLRSSIPRGEKEMVQRRVLDMMRVGSSRFISLRPKMAQELKFEIDALLRKRGDDAISKNAAESLKEVRETLIDQIEKTNPGYRAANRAYAQRTEGINELEESLLGVIQSKPDARLATITKLFEEKDINAVKRMKGLIDQQDPAAFPALYKAWMDDKVQNISGLRSASNPAEKIHNALFGSDSKARRVFEFAPTPQVEQNLRWFRDWLETVKTVRVKSGGAGGDAVDILLEGGRTEAVQGWRAAALKFVGQLYDSRRAEALGDVLMSPRWAEEMRYIRNLPPKSAANAFDSVVNRALDFMQAEGSRSELTGQRETELPNINVR